MKRIFFMMLIANALTIVSLSSCKKDNLTPGAPIDTSISNFPANSTTINLIAGYWLKDANGIYFCNFPGVISGWNTGSHSPKIYLVENGKETRINSSVLFMGGELWAVNSQTDVKIIYHCYAQDVPFSYLNIKVVIE
jgi:hypothetical protein